MKHPQHVSALVALLPLIAGQTAERPTWYVWEGHYYGLTPQLDDWAGAQATAESYGANLVTINDNAESIWLVQTFASNRAVWIGFYQPPGTSEPDSGWQWVSGEPVTFVNWHSGQPNEVFAGDDYALLNSDAPDGVWFTGEWGDVPLAGWNGPHFGIIELDPKAVGIPTIGNTAIALLAIGLLVAGWQLTRRVAPADAEFACETVAGRITHYKPGVFPCPCDSRPALAAAVLAFAASTAFAQPTFQGLGDLPGGIFNSEARGVSADGSTVVGYSRTASGDRAVRWTLADGIQALPLLPPFPESRAFGASADGSVIVGEAFSSTESMAFRWSVATGILGLGRLGGIHSAAMAVSTDGDVVVGDTQSPTGYLPFRWTVGQGMQALELLPSCAYGFGRNVSADGTIVVGYCNTVSGENGIRWDADGQPTDIGFLPGGNRTNLYGVSSDGQICVGQGQQAAGTVVAIRWSQGEGLVSLGQSAGGTPYLALSASSDGGVIVGSGQVPTGEAARVWDSANGLRNLQDVLTTYYGLDLTGWTLNRAYAVSGDGTTIVGEGRNPDGQSEAWVAHVPTYPVPVIPAMSGRTAAVFLIALSVIGALVLSRRTRIIPAAAGYVAFNAAGPAVFGQATFQAIGEPPHQSVAHAVSANGEFVVGFATAAEGAEAFRWTQATGLELIGRLSGYPSTSAEGVSADGATIVGFASGSGPSQGFRWTEATGMSPLGGIMVSDVSDDGFVVVGDDLVWCGNMWGFAGDGCHTNADGSVMALGHRHFVCDNNGNLVQTNMAASGEIAAKDLSPDGNWVVGQPAFRWSASAGLQSLGDGAALGVSANGSVVVGEGLEGAFIWDATNGRRALQDVLENEYCLDLSGWDLVSAFAVSDDGLTIVGVGTNPLGRAWVVRLTATPTISEVNCSDAADDDCDGYTDCADLDCADNVAACPNGRIPTVSVWGLAILALMTLAAGTLMLNRRPSTSNSHCVAMTHSAG